MNHTEKFNETVGILVKAYKQDAINPTDCAACAVGNLVAAANDYTIRPHDWKSKAGRTVGPAWQEVVWEKRGEQVSTKSDRRRGRAQIASTGYSLPEFDSIEGAFMTALDGHSSYGSTPDKISKGLMAVVDVLADIHGIDLATAAASKALFVK